MKKLILILVLPVFLFFLIAITGALLIAPGSYANSETYLVNIDYQDSDSIMKQLKEKYPKLQPYLKNDNGELVKDEDGNGFIVYHLPSINYSIACRIYSSENQKQTQISLVNVVKIGRDRSPKRINTKELSKDENNEVKKAFETDVLDKLGKWEHGANAFLRFLGFH